MADIVRKVCMCGDPNVGKTSLVRRFIHGKYDDKYISTLGTVVSKKNVPTKKNDNLTMMIWDISGQPEFKRIHSSAFKNAKGGIAVCDVTRPETAEHLQEWITTLRKNAGENVPVIVFANKTDLTDDKEADVQKTTDLLDGLHCNVIMTSAKTGVNVNDAFKSLAQTMTMGTVNDHIEDTKEEEEEIPPSSFTPQEFLDYMAISFSKVLGDEELAMHMVRKQVKDAGIDFRKITKDQAESLIATFSKIILEYKGKEFSRQFRHDLLKHFANCRR